MGPIELDVPKEETFQEKYHPKSLQMLNNRVPKFLEQINTIKPGERFIQIKYAASTNDFKGAIGATVAEENELECEIWGLRAHSSPIKGFSGGANFSDQRVASRLQAYLSTRNTSDDLFVWVASVVSAFMQKTRSPTYFF